MTSLLLEIWPAIPLLVFIVVVSLFIIVMFLGTELSRCTRCGVKFHDLDDVLLIITPFGIKARHSYRCSERRGCRERAKHQ